MRATTGLTILTAIAAPQALAGESLMLDHDALARMRSAEFTTLSVGSGSFSGERALGSKLVAAGLGGDHVADNTFVKARLSTWITRTEGNKRVGNNLPGAINDLDLEGTLGFDPDEYTLMLQVAAKIPVVNLEIDFGWLGSFEFGGTTTSPTGISFNNAVYTGTVTTEDSFNLYEFNVVYEALELGPVKLWAGLGARIFDFDAFISGTVGGISGVTDTQSVIAPLPLGVVRARLDLGKHAYIEGELGGMTYGDYGDIVDWSVEGGWDFIRFVGVFAGYRTILAEGNTEINFDLDISGFYAGAEVRF